MRSKLMVTFFWKSYNLKMLNVVRLISLRYNRQFQSVHTEKAKLTVMYRIFVSWLAELNTVTKYLIKHYFYCI